MGVVIQKSNRISGARNYDDLLTMVQIEAQHIPFNHADGNALDNRVSLSQVLGALRCTQLTVVRIPATLQVFPQWV